jgi:UDPglucose 6-dehydrogenase
MKLAVWGLGKLGLPLASVLTRDGHQVLGYDPDEKRVNWCIEQQSLERSSGVNIIDEPEVSVTDILFCKEPEPADLNFIVVPTPSLESGEFDSFMVQEALQTICEVNKRHTTAVITSTVFPGTSQRLDDLYGDRATVVYNPTFIALGSVVQNLIFPNILLYGVSEEDDVSLVDDVWKNVIAVSTHHTHIGPYVEAELLKLSINCALATKISLANSLGQLFSEYGVDPSMVSEIGADPRIGTAFMLPGVPISGPCLPRDNKALQKAAYDRGMRLPLSEATEDVDFELRMRLYNAITDELPRWNSTVGILGMSYKYGVPLAEGSIGAWLHKHLLDDGYAVTVFDDQLPCNSAEDVLSTDVVVVCHKELSRLSEHAKGEVIHVWS